MAHYQKTLKSTVIPHHITSTEIIGAAGMAEYLKITPNYVTQIMKKYHAPKSERRAYGKYRVLVWQREEVDKWISIYRNENQYCRIGRGETDGRSSVNI